MEALSYIKKLIWQWLGKEKLIVGKKAYSRWRYFPNLFAFQEEVIHHEAWLGDIYESVLGQKEGAFIDVGANRGQTLLKVLRIDSRRKYVGFEPQIAPCFAIEHFLIENELANHTILPIGLSDKYDTLSLKVRGNDYGSLFSSSSSMIDKFRPESFYDFSNIIFVAPGDEVISDLELSAISVIKIDVEGAELEVVKGLESSIGRYRPYIVFEVLHHYMVVTEDKLRKEVISFRESRLKKLEEIIRGKSYSIYHIIGKDEIRRVGRITPKEINDPSSTDYLAVPQEEEDSFVMHIQEHRVVHTG